MQSNIRVFHEFYSVEAPAGSFLGTEDSAARKMLVNSGLSSYINALDTGQCYFYFKKICIAGIVIFFIYL